MKVQKLERIRFSFMEKMTSKDPKTLRIYNVTINNFENFCMEKYGKADFVSELKDCDSDGVFDVLQSWINWNGNLAQVQRRFYSHESKNIFTLVGGDQITSTRHP